MRLTLRPVFLVVPYFLTSSPSRSGWDATTHAGRSLRQIEVTQPDWPTGEPKHEHAHSDHRNAGLAPLLTLLSCEVAIAVNTSPLLTSHRPENAALVGLQTVAPEPVVVGRRKFLRLDGDDRNDRIIEPEPTSDDREPGLIDGLLSAEQQTIPVYV